MTQVLFCDTSVTKTEKNAVGVCICVFANLPRNNDPSAIEAQGN